MDLDLERRERGLGVSSGFECGACIWIQMGDRAFDTINVVHASGFRWEIVIQVGAWIWI